MEQNAAYQAPKEALTDPSDDQIATEISLFSFSSRIGRLRYLAYSFGLMLLINIAVAILMGVVAGISGSSELMIASVAINTLLALVISFVVAVRRFHDLGTSGWAALLMIIPVINFFVALYLIFAPGTQGRNRFGPQPPNNGVGVIITALIVPFIFVAGILAAIVIPAYQDYSIRAQQAEQQYSQPYDTDSPS